MPRCRQTHPLLATLRRFALLFCLANGLLLAAAHGQKAVDSTPQSPAPASTGTPCVAPADLTPAHLHGNWTVTWLAAPAATAGSGTGTATNTITSTTTASATPMVTGTARLELAPNPDYPESVIGTLIDGKERHELAGDLDQGLLTLEESADGKSISANWAGLPQAGKCGREIQGNWLSATSALQRGFVLRRLAGW